MTDVTVDLYGFICHPQILGLGLISCDFSASKMWTICLVQWKINLHFAFYVEESLLIGSNTLEPGG